VAPRPEYKPGLLPVGRPSKNVMQQRYRAQQVFFDPEVVSDDDIKDIVRRAVSDAKDGNAQARDFVAAYRFGRPKPMDEGGLSITVEGDNTRIALLSDEALEALIALGHAPTIDDDPAHADQVVDAEYRALPGDPGPDL
jgi:hypothetical protein